MLIVPTSYGDGLMGILQVLKRSINLPLWMCRHYSTVHEVIG